MVNAPRGWAEAVHSSRIQLTVAGRNLTKWTGYSGVDPDVNYFERNRFTTQDFGVLPAVRYWSLRLDVGF